MNNKQFLQNVDKTKNEEFMNWLAEREAERPLREKRGRAFAEAREAAGISRNKMAKLTGLAWKTIEKFECGDVVKRAKFVETALWNSLQLTEIKAAGKAIPELLKFLVLCQQARSGKAEDASNRCGRSDGTNPVKLVTPFTLLKNII